MSKKICVYAICKNESKFVDRWYQSIKEADYIVVLDTGSTDNTVELLKKYEPHVTVETEIIDPWRFDVARNKALAMVPGDAEICVVADFDHIFRAGWADELRHQFDLGFNEVYGDIIDYDDSNNEIKRFLSKNVHLHDNRWTWERPIHESLVFHGEPQDLKGVVSRKFIIEHHPDRTKSRDGYLDLLRMEYEENNTDPKCAIYYGCELSFHGRNSEAHEVFLKSLEECEFKTQEDNDILVQTHLNIADEYIFRQEFDKALEHLQLALENTAFITRRIYMSFYKLYITKYHTTSDISYIDNAIEYVYKALYNVRENIRDWREDDIYWEDECFKSLVYCYNEKKDYMKALGFNCLVIDYNPKDKDALELRENILNNLIKKGER